ncbi:hypothetical protein EVAR_102138_1 [Eumeta japonica]|uniref:Uncharacterized protein n=1 Tax=Eumeta variegata TaxID=151549 RepID=A0A4C1U027_EUMVA|nr:hypothetical protein EVAR_102138_1 [Eumeta japonica]
MSHQIAGEEGDYACAVTPIQPIPPRGELLNLYYEPHSTDVAFGRRYIRTSFTQIVRQISVTTYELVKPAINIGKRWSVIMKS